MTDIQEQWCVCGQPMSSCACNTFDDQLTLYVHNVPEPELVVPMSEEEAAAWGDSQEPVPHFGYDVELGIAAHERRMRGVLGAVLIDDPNEQVPGPGFGGNPCCEIPLGEFVSCALPPPPYETRVAPSGAFIVKRTFNIRHTTVGPRHDPYARTCYRVHERWSDGAERRISYVVCALSGCWVVVNDRVTARDRVDLLAEKPTTFAEQEVERRLGVRADIFVRLCERAEARYREPCMACGSESCGGSCVI